MKVDKAVCTNDMSFVEDLNRAIRFEAVFSTLVENKILAIKRECELKRKSKKSRSLRRMLFGRKCAGSGNSSRKSKGTDDDGKLEEVPVASDEVVVEIEEVPSLVEEIVIPIDNLNMPLENEQCAESEEVISVADEVVEEDHVDQHGDEVVEIEVEGKLGARFD